MMLERIEHVIELVLKSRKNNKTMMLTAGVVAAFGVAVGAISIYDHLIKKLEIEHAKEDEKESSDLI